MHSFLADIATNPRKRNILAAIVSLVGFIVDFTAFYPGLVSPDTLDQYKQARDNSYGDWHPPTMAAWWHVLLGIYHGTQPMLIFQCLLLWASCFVLLSSFLKHQPRLAYLVPLVFIAPFVQNFVGNIWKDLNMSLSWLLAASLLISAYLDKMKLGPLKAGLCLLLIFYGCWVRISGFPAIIPLLFLWWRLALPQSRFTRPFPSIIASLILTVTVMKMESIFTTHVLKARRDHIEYKLIAHDLQGISVKSGEWCFPSYMMSWKNFDTTYLRREYTSYSFDHIYWNNEKIQILPELNDEQLHDLNAVWRKSILKHPWVYFKNKLNGYLYFLRIKNSGNELTVVYPFSYPNDLGFSFAPNFFSKLVFKPVELQARMFYMKPWFWFLLTVSLIVIILVKMRSNSCFELLFCMGLSSLFYFIIHFFVFPADTEFRYTYWNCLSTSLTLILMVFASRFKRQEVKT